MQPVISVSMSSSNDIDINTLAINWLALEKQADCSFYLTWSWMEHWLKTLPTEYCVLQAHKNNAIVGLAIVVKAEKKLFGCFSIQQWWLNRSGDQRLDQCWIEYNDFLIAKQYQEETRTALLHYIKSQQSWDEFIVGMSNTATLKQFNCLSNNTVMVFKDVGYVVNYTQVQDSYEKNVLSKNTRQKLRQSDKLLAQQGDFSLEIIQGKDKKLHLADLALLHIKRWQDSDTPSGFTNPFFQKMLNHLIDDPQVEIIVMRQNDVALGYLINFVYQGRVYFYLSALTKISNNKIKLGMLLHQLAINYYQEQGMQYYDFLAGDARYKKSLTNFSYQQNMACFYRQGVLLFLEHKLRHIKHWLCAFLSK